MVVKALVGAVASACLMTPGLGFAQEGNPFEGDSVAIAVGARLYVARCADCHSPDALGDRGPNLIELWASGGVDQRFFDAIRDGVPNSIMPPSFGADDEIWALVAYLGSISTVPPYENSSGDIERGRAFFTMECSQCHLVDGSGGTLGPDLSRIAQVRTREALVRAIRDPSDSVALGYRAVTLVTKRGERIEGLVKGEDAFSIQIVDTNERMQGYSKADLAALDRNDKSLMPRLGRRRLNESELDDLLAFLGTLRTDSSASL
jgi:cytochrome c oxidase cbb3-type subunit 3